MPLGSLEAADRYLDLSARRSESVPGARRGQLRLLLGVVRLLLARQRGDLPAATQEAGRGAARGGEQANGPW